MDLGQEHGSDMSSILTSINERVLHMVGARFWKCGTRVWHFIAGHPFNLLFI